MLCGCYVDCGGAGLGDRHADNVMVRTDGVKFDIDYQCLFGEEPSRAHQALMSLTPLRADAEWLTCVGEENKQLVKTVMDITYKMMRRHAGGFLKYTSTLQATDGCCASGLFMCFLQRMADMDPKYSFVQIEEQLSGT